MVARLQHIVVDCDAGIDDALAILYLLASPKVRIEAITTVGGNVTAAQSGANVEQLLRLVGVSRPLVVPGSEFTIDGDRPDYGEMVHGSDGMGGVLGAEPFSSKAGSVGDRAVSGIIRLAREFRGKLEILALGPLTNLARALRSDPNLAANVKRVIVMGGAVNHPGNGTPVAEANIRNDSAAAEVVLGADWDVTLVPLDVTMRQRILESHCRRLASSEDAAVSLVGRALEHYLSFHKGVHFPERSGALHDPLAAATLVGSVLVSSAPRLQVIVDRSHGISHGATVADARGMYLGFPESVHANARVVLDVSTKNFADNLTRQVLSLGRSVAARDRVR